MAKDRARKSTKSERESAKAAKKAGTGASRARKTLKAGVAADTAGGILAWEDDPGSAAAPLPTALPIDLQSHPVMKASVIWEGSGSTPVPKEYARDTQEFRYWNGVKTLERGIGFWRQVVEGVPGARQGWEFGSDLRVKVDGREGGIESYYSSAQITCYHLTSGGRTIYTGESSDVLLHELGHAVFVVQMGQPQGVEPGALCEALADLSSFFCALQVDGLLQQVVGGGGRLAVDSRLTRWAEESGIALYASDKDSYESDCVRRLITKLCYQDTGKLPASSPIAQLSQEPHNLGRLFSTAIIDAMDLMASLEQGGKPTVIYLKSLAVRVGGYLVAMARQMSFEKTEALYVAARTLVQLAAACNDEAAKTAFSTAFMRRGISLPALSVEPFREPGSKAADFALTLHSVLPFLDLHTAEPHRLLLEVDAGKGVALIVEQFVGKRDDNAKATAFVASLMNRGEVAFGDGPLRSGQTHRLQFEGGSWRLRIERYAACGLRLQPGVSAPTLSERSGGATHSELLKQVV